MPRRTDINHVLVIGSGPIVIGQACEFDYSGTQACRVLKSEGLRVTLVNSNPATIMTDPEFADATYVEPITPEFIDKILTKEAADGHPVDAVLATLGGQTALNAAMQLDAQGLLDKHGVELIGADIPAINRGEDRQTFKDIVASVGGESARSAVCHTMEEVHATVAELGLPVVVRPSFTMGGLGSGLAYTTEDLERIAGGGLSASPTANVLIEESILGWKEYELELMRDNKDNVVVICSIENVDALGVHTGDSVTVAPSMTLTDREFQNMRDLGIAIIRAVGVDTGGCNIQFAINPVDGRLVVIEMNPRVSRSSALASKATGFPIAKIAARLAIGYSLDEITNDITGETPACFEPTLDYVVVKAPRFAFEKFPGADDTLTTTMKSVGEAMSLGRNYREALGKVMRSLETKASGFWTLPDETIAPGRSTDVDAVLADLVRPTEGRMYDVELALRLGATVQQVHEASGIDPWFLEEVAELVDLRREIVDAAVLGADLLRRAKHNGLSDAQIAALRPEFAGAEGVQRLRHRLGIRPVYKTVDTCAAEFEAKTPYHYSTYELDPAAESEVAPQTEREKVIILGSGPNRIGQGIEFDYCCVHAALAMREDGYETIMVNCNPETVSTDYDTSDRLYFEPLTLEDVLEIVDKEKPTGVIVQYGGQTPLKLALGLEAAGVPIIGTSPDMIDAAEDRERFQQLLHELGLRQPPNATARAEPEALEKAAALGYPLVVRPSYVLGGRAMEIVHEQRDLERYMREAVKVSNDSPVLLDRFLNDAIECDVDAIRDHTGRVFIGGVMEHIEQAGVHSGDSACSLPPYYLKQATVDELKRQTAAMAQGLNVIGLMNVQFAIQEVDGQDVIYVLEVNPRASRTVPFVSKATGIQLAKVAARCMAGQSLDDQGIGAEVNPPYFSVKEAVFPFVKFPGVDTILGPEMKSTGEVMGVGKTFGEAFVKSQLGAGTNLPRPHKADGSPSGKVFLTVKNGDKPRAVEIARALVAMGFELVATRGTAAAIAAAGVPVVTVNKVTEGRPHIVDMIKNGDISLVINTVEERRNAITDSRAIRTSSLLARVTTFTTIFGAEAAVEGMKYLDSLGVISVQEMHAQLAI